MIKKDTAFIILVIVMVITAITFGKLGESHVIREQKIAQTEQGYQVEFNGNLYEYTD